MQTSPPALPLVSGIRRDVGNTLDAGLLQRLCGSFGTGCAALAAAITHEHDFNFLLKGVHVGYVRWGDGAAAEHANMREFIEVS